MHLKKWLVTLGLGLVLLASAGGAALANTINEDSGEGTTEISGSLASRYTVEIPSEIPMGNFERGTTTGVKFSVTARNVTLQTGSQLNVSVKGEGRSQGETAFDLKNADTYLSYEVWQDNDDSDDVQISPGGVFAKFPNSIPQDGKAQNGFIYVRPNDQVIAGTYRGNLIFTCDITYPDNP